MKISNAGQRPDNNDVAGCYDEHGDGGERSYRYWFLDHLKAFGIPSGGGWTEFDNTWSKNLIELEFINDKNKVTIAVRAT